MVKRTLALSVVALGIIGCGGGSSSSSTTSTVLPNTTESYAKVVQVERGPVLRAVVIDGVGNIARELGNGEYGFLQEPVGNIKVYGGVIDVNRDGIIDAGDVNNTLDYATNGEAATIVSTLGLKADIRNYLKETYGLSDTQIDNDTPDNNDVIGAISDEVYAYCVENNKKLSDVTLDEVKALEAQIQNRLQEYKQVQNRVTLEEELMNSLNVPKLTPEEVQNIQTYGYMNNAGIIYQLPKFDLNATQKYSIAYMWNEEKLAHDVYLALYSKYPNLYTLKNIAEQSESTHMSMVEELAKKYDLNITNYQNDYKEYFDANALAQYGLGEFFLPQISDLYTQLYNLGSQSQIDALKVGCMIEVTDIDDLDKWIADAGDAADIVVVFNNLRNGSYHHYWAFDAALKSLGVSEGCCAAGEQYCKTPEEYPISTGGATGIGYHGGR
jgi:hypothetical protein